MGARKYSQTPLFSESTSPSTKIDQLENSGFMRVFMTSVLPSTLMTSDEFGRPVDFGLSYVLKVALRSSMSRTSR